MIKKIFLLVLLINPALFAMESNEIYYKLCFLDPAQTCYLPFDKIPLQKSLFKSHQEARNDAIFFNMQAYVLDDGRIFGIENDGPIGMTVPSEPKANKKEANICNNLEYVSQDQYIKKLVENIMNVKDENDIVTLKKFIDLGKSKFGNKTKPSQMFEWRYFDKDQLVRAYSRATQNTKRCPSCDKLVKKNEGCKYIKCDYCQELFCQKCERSFGKNLTGDVNSLLQHECRHKSLK